MRKTTFFYCGVITGMTMSAVSGMNLGLLPSLVINVLMYVIVTSSLMVMDNVMSKDDDDAK